MGGVRGGASSRPSKESRRFLARAWSTQAGSAAVGATLGLLAFFRLPIASCLLRHSFPQLGWSIASLLVPPDADDMLVMG